MVGLWSRMIGWKTWCHIHGLASSFWQRRPMPKRCNGQLRNCPMPVTPKSGLEPCMCVCVCVRTYLWVCVCGSACYLSTLELRTVTLLHSLLNWLKGMEDQMIMSPVSFWSLLFHFPQCYTTSCIMGKISILIEKATETKCSQYWQAKAREQYILSEDVTTAIKNIKQMLT